MTQKYLFYPGCSMEKTASAYLDSLRQIEAPLDLHLQDIPDWNCCGATEYAADHVIAAHALVGRNLAIAQDQINGTRTLMAACAACFLNLSKTDHYMREYPEVEKLVNESLAAGGLHYDAGSLEVRHLLSVLLDDIGLDVIRSKVVKPLMGMRVAAYYGCQVPRPDYNKVCENSEYPQGLEEIMAALGAEVIDFPFKTHCCGGHMTQISESTAYELIHRLIAGADQYKADVLVTLCPMCQLNLDAYQGAMNKYFNTDYHIPVIYFTQLIALAFGSDPIKAGFGKEFVDANTALRKIGLESPRIPDEAVAPPTRKVDSKKALPMPARMKRTTARKEKKA
jgi:heterodisulfide reductase subunit B